MQDSSGWICLCANLTDRFADNGIVTVVAGELLEETLHVRLWLMSCRVLKRGLEDFMMNTLLDAARQSGAGRIVGYYYPTAKNGMVRDFYERFGFTLMEEDDQGNRTYVLETDSYQEKKTRIKSICANQT